MNKKTALTGIFSLLLIGIVTITVFEFARPQEFRGTSYVEPYPPAFDFSLTTNAGDEFSLHQLQGKIILLFFGYTSCPDVCPTTLAELNQSVQLLGEQAASRVQVIFISVDPDRDTPERTQEYVNNFNKNFIGLSGSDTDLQPVWDAYGIYREIVDNGSSAGYIVDHVARVTLIDGNQNMRLSYGFDTPVDDIVHDIKLILKE